MVTQIAGYVVTASSPTEFELEGPMNVYTFDSAQKLKDFFGPSEFSDGHLGEVEAFLEDVREHFGEGGDLIAEFEAALREYGPTFHYDEESGWKMLDGGTEPVFYRLSPMSDDVALLEYARGAHHKTERATFDPTGVEAAAEAVANYVQ